MEAALKIQVDLQKNMQDLQNYMWDLNNWEEEMKKKEDALNNENPPENNIPPPRNKVKRIKPDNIKSTEKPKKISAYDYNAWDKFDVDKACADLDNEQNNDEKEHNINEEKPESYQNESNSNNNQLSLIDEAFYEKELGNQFVKKGQWNDAIKCYTKAISLDSKNPIYYANRSLCFLKLKNFKSAEVDATVAIQLDKNYIKAFQRRAIARLALGQLIESRSDYEAILKLEPMNAIALVEINKINKKLNENSAKTAKEMSEKSTFNPKSIFSFEKNKSQKKIVNDSKPNHLNSNSVEKTDLIKNVTCTVTSVKSETVSIKDVTLNPEEKHLEEFNSKNISKTSKESNNVFKELPEWCKIVEPVTLPPHKRSKRPLRRVVIKAIEAEPKDLSKEEILIQQSKLDVTKEDKTFTKPEKINFMKLENKNSPELKNFSFDVPKTSIQFQNHWDIVKQTPQKAYEYLKKIPATQLPQIFENSLESGFFSELVRFISSDEIKTEPDVVYSFLLGLTNVKRFNFMILFLSTNDKNCLKKCITELRNIKSDEEISNLHRLYEL